MIWLALLAAQATAETTPLARGAVIFSKTCAVAYCHGPEGSPGRAPQLAGRALARANVERAIREGVPNTAMPGWRTQLPAPDLDAVIAYVMSLGSVTPPAVKAAAPAAPASEVKRGRDLFFDAARLVNCGVCHAVEDRGIEVGPDVLAGGAALRSPPARRVKTAHPAGEVSFPALVARQSKESWEVYDLSASLPVLRFFPVNDVKIAEGTTWTHAAATTSYSDQDLEVVLKYLRSIRPAP